MWLLSKNQLVRALPLLLVGVQSQKENPRWKAKSGEIEDTTKFSEVNNAGKMSIERRKGIERFAADDIDHFCDSIETCKNINPPNSPNRNKVSYQRTSVSDFHQVRWARVQRKRRRDILLELQRPRCLSLGSSRSRRSTDQSQDPQWRRFWDRTPRLLRQ